MLYAIPACCFNILSSRTHHICALYYCFAHRHTNDNHYFVMLYHWVFGMRNILHTYIPVFRLQLFYNHNLNYQHSISYHSTPFHLQISSAVCSGDKRISHGNPLNQVININTMFYVHFASHLSQLYSLLRY